MNPRDLSKLAKDCRTQAKHLSGAERKLLLEIADAFQDIAWSRKAHKFVDSTRCW